MQLLVSLLPLIAPLLGVTGYGPPPPSYGPPPPVYGPPLYKHPTPKYVDECYPQTVYKTLYEKQVEKIPVYSTVYKPQYIPTTVYEKVYKTIHKTHLVPEYIPQYITETKYRDNYITDVVYKTEYNTIYKSIYITETELLPTYITKTDYITQIETRYQPQYITETKIEPVVTTKVVYRTEVIYETKYPEKHLPKPKLKPHSYGGYQGPVYVAKEPVVEVETQKRPSGVEEPMDPYKDLSYGDASLLSDVDLKSIGLVFKDGKVQKIEGTDTELSDSEDGTADPGSVTGLKRPSFITSQNLGQLPLENESPDLGLLGFRGSGQSFKSLGQGGITFDGDFKRFTIDLSALDGDLALGLEQENPGLVVEGGESPALGLRSQKQTGLPLGKSKGLIAEAPLAMAVDGETLEHHFVDLDELNFETDFSSGLTKFRGPGSSRSKSPFPFSEFTKDSFGVEDAKVQPRFKLDADLHSGIGFRTFGDHKFFETAKKRNF